ncbi:interleukin-15 receptor subunit alpha [Ammospiza nelsoni]|uniref:interleukin-15 receptor subunit alpha n=1 Tax=Ammospiza nelsoni TaxID=2857394 RepID=UPI00286A20A0|nr:interleukin-15 receptor subunit alpha [Ammospiza nelsoni]
MERSGLEGNLGITSFRVPPWTGTPSSIPGCSKPRPTHPWTLPGMRGGEIAQHSQRFSHLPVVIPCFFPIPVHCSPPKAVANAHIDAGNRTELNSRLRYSCKPGYKRKAGTSSLIQCVLWNGSQPRWTDPTLQCIRDPALSREAPGAASTTQRAGTTSASPNSSPSPAPSQSPVPPAPDGPSPDGSRPPEMVPTPDTSTLGEGTTPLPIPPSDYAAGWADCQGMPTSPGAWCIHKGSLTFPMELLLLSDLLFSEAPPSIHPSPTFAAQHFLFSPLFQFPSGPWPLLLDSWRRWPSELRPSAAGGGGGGEGGGGKAPGRATP